MFKALLAAAAIALIVVFSATLALPLLAGLVLAAGVSAGERR